MSDPKLYKIFAEPQTQTVTPGAQVTYTCGQTYATISAASGPHDQCSWYCFNDREAVKNSKRPHIVAGPQGFQWKEATWAFPGRHTIQCRVQFTDGRISYYDYPQWVEGLELFMAKALYTSQQQGFNDPLVTLTRTQRYIKTLKDIATKIPITDSEQKRKHEQSLKEYETYCDKLGERMASTENSLRIPINAVHLEKTTQKTSKLNVFIACTERSAKGQTWLLVDWTNPIDRTHTGEYTGSGENAAEAIRDAIDSWDSGNRYYDGTISWEVGDKVCGQALHGQFETDGASTWDSVSTFFTWIATGAAVIAGVVTLVAPVPGSQVVSAAIWTAIFSSTAAAVINIGQRHEEGFGSWKEDAIDGLTIVGNVFAGAGMWARGGAVIARNAEGKVIKYILVGQITTDSVQGILIAEEQFAEYESIMNDKSLLPDERARRLLLFFSGVAVTTTMTYINLKGTHADLDNIGKKPKYVEVNERTKPGGQKLDDLKDPNKVIDTTKPPEAEGHTKDGRQKTTVQEEQLRIHEKKTLQKTKFKKPPEPPKRGMSSKHDRSLSRLAKKEKVIILVRDSNEAAAKWVGKKGYKPKPESVKAKTLKSGENAGLASADPNNSKMKELLAADGTDYATYVKKMQEKGYKIGDPPDYLVTNAQTGDKYYSDYDLHGVYEDGTGVNKYTEDFRKAMNKESFNGQEMVQHGPHDGWPERNAKAAGPNRGPQPPVTAYLPDGTQVHLENIGDMKKFYAEHGIQWKEIYPEDFHPDNYPS